MSVETILPGGAFVLAPVLAIVVFSGILRGLTGFGFAIVAVPLLSSVVEPRLAVAIAAPLQLAIGLLDAPKAWGLAHRPPMAGLLMGALVGTPLGMIALRVTPAGPQRLVVAVAALVALAAVWRGRVGRDSVIAGHPGPVGFVSGLLNGLAAMPGPPVVTYFLTAPISDGAARASLIVYFAVTSLFAVAAGFAVGIIDTPAMWLALLCLPFLIVGNWLGALLFGFGHAALYRVAGLAALALAAAAAAWKGFASLG